MPVVGLQWIAVFQAAYAAELALLAELEASLLGGGEGLAAVDGRSARRCCSWAGSFLEHLLARDAGHRGPRVE